MLEFVSLFSFTGICVGRIVVVGVGVSTGVLVFVGVRSFVLLTAGVLLGAAVGETVGAAVLSNLLVAVNLGAGVSPATAAV